VDTASTVVLKQTVRAHNTVKPVKKTKIGTACHTITTSPRLKTFIIVIQSSR